jgi:polysaccharide export outer membrane protein
MLSSISCIYFSSCSAPKNITYFKDVPDTVKRKVVDIATYATPVIRPDDILEVTIQTIDPGATVLLNKENTTNWPLAGSSAGTGNNISGYLVDKDGYVLIPLVGKILVKDKTTSEVRDIVSKKAAEYFKDPVVNVRFANFKITVLGEVARPSTYVMPNEKVTLLDAIGAAGDLTIYGKRENILLIRDKNGKKEMIRFNLNKSDLFTSPYYYLQQGDVVYVEPNKTKVASTDMAKFRTASILISVVSVLVVISTKIKF